MEQTQGERHMGASVVNEQEARGGLSDSRRAALAQTEREAGAAEDASGSGAKKSAGAADEPARSGTAPQVEQPEKSANSPVQSW